MFNKLKFNNLVISNKKGIQQSRIQTINKLVHKIRKLKSLDQKHPDNLKCKERIRKSMETMEILKKLKRVDIMKKLLLMDKPATSVITNGTSIPEEIAVALLAMNKVMKNLVKRFKTELKINELEEDNWKQILMEASKRARKGERTEERRRKRLEIKQQKATERKRQEWLEENQPKIEVEELSIDTDANLSTIGAWKIEKLSDKSGGEDEKATNYTTKDAKRKIEEKPFAEKPLVNKEEFIKTKLFDRAKNNSLEGSEKRLNIVNENYDMPKTNKNEEESLVLDPFFITGTGENYLSTAINAKENISEEENGEEKVLHMGKLNKFGRKHLEFHGSENRRRQLTNKWESRDRQNKQKNNKDNRNNKFSRNDFSDKKVLSKSNDKNILHPSWAAKHKFKPVITGFKGKKITFDDDLNKTTAYSENNIPNKISMEKKSNNPEKDSLHPSWAAKQKLKPTITTFQGKKISFEDNE